jgi:BASS family bile acid:Na+ symporter
MNESKTILDIGVLLVSVLLMITVGMELAPQHFSDVAKRKGILICLFAGQVVVLPLLGVILVRLLSLPPHISAGILLLAACPVGDIANFYTLLARGNIALSVTMNTITCLMSMLTMALVFAAYDLLWREQFVYAVPAPALVLRLTLMVAVPVLAGMMIRRFKPRWTVRYANLLRNASIVGIGFLLVYVMVTQHTLLKTDWQLTAISSTAFMGLALLLGAGFGWLLGLSAGDTLTVGIVYAVRNVGLAMAIAVTLLNQVEYAVFAVVYFLTEVPLLLGVAAVYRCRRSQVS